MGVTTVGIYTAPSSTTTVVIGITCANTSGNGITVGIGITRASSDDIHLMKKNKVVLETTDTITAKSDTAGSLDVALTIMEIT